MTHPTSGLDDLVHQRARLGILAVVHEAPRVEFGWLRQVLDLTAGNLSRHLQALEDGGLVTIDKGYEGRRAKTWIRITPPGRRALADEIDHLKALIAQIEGPAEPPRADT